MVGKSSNKADSNGWTWIFRNNKEDYGTYFMGVKENIAFVRLLSNTWIGNYHVYVTVARFQRSDTASNGTRIPHEKPSFASVVHKSHKTNGDSSSNTKVSSLTLNEQDVIRVHDVSKVTLVKLKEVGSISRLYRICRNEGFDGLKIHHVGRLWIWIQFPSVDERMIWVKISGFPLCAWGSNAFKKMASVFGKFMFFKDEQSSTMSMGKVCISTNSQTFLTKKVHIDIHGEIFKVQVHKLGTWSINIIDDYLDSSSNDNGDKEEKVCDSVDEEADNGMENIFNNDNEIKEGEDCNVSGFKDHPFNNDDCNVMNEDSNNCNDQLITT
ncbi:hypothetical protein Tco_1337739 [Tanacetum coccineum]